MNSSTEPLVYRGSSALLISVPHSGTAVPADLLERFSGAGKALPDTDWYVDRLYEWAVTAGAGMIRAPQSRYVVDLNRPPDDAPLYASAETKLLTGLLPTQTFSGLPIYLPGAEPDDAETKYRVETYWQPYHRCLEDELNTIKKSYGFAVLLDAHSIRSQEPLLFQGVLPDLNLGSNNGRSADRGLVESAVASLKDSDYSLVLDGRFKGGHITRHFGCPDRGIHALQLEMAQSVYMQEETREWDAARALRAQVLLKKMVNALLQWQPEGLAK